jgi:N-acetyl-gamma-glutamyl-phosphate reductase
MEKIRVGIIGAAGYTGGELIRILLHHPLVEICFAMSSSQTGKAISEVHTDLAGDCNLSFTDQLSPNIDVLFLCSGHGQSKAFLEQNHIPKGVRIIDLSQDFRLGESLKSRKFVYGLPEAHRSSIKVADNIANPGCFATAIQLALLPLASGGFLAGRDVHISGITGSTGAGVGLSSTSHFSWRANNLSTYKTFNHQHLAEIKQTLSRLSPQEEPEANLFFVPYRGPFTRGIWITAYLRSTKSIEFHLEQYQAYFQNHPFTHLYQGELNLKQVVNTNKALVKLEKHGDQLLVYSIIDNLVKGASGQAIQNMNLAFGLDETTGLHLKSTVF